METKNFKKQETKDDIKEDKSVENANDTGLKNQLSNKDKQLFSKDEEIKRLKAQLSEAKKVNTLKKGDIRAEVNRLGDVKRICIGVDADGHRLWKKATELTDSDIKRREKYIESIKQNNAKKY